MSNKEDSSNKQKKTMKPVVAKPFVSQSKFGGNNTGSFQQKSQYKPSPVRITQHKG